MAVYEIATVPTYDEADYLAPISLGPKVRTKPGTTHALPELILKLMRTSLVTPRNSIKVAAETSNLHVMS